MVREWLCSKTYHCDMELFCKNVLWYACGMVHNILMCILYYQWRVVYHLVYILCKLYDQYIPVQNAKDECVLDVTGVNLSGAFSFCKNCLLDSDDKSNIRQILSQQCAKRAITKVYNKHVPH